MVDPPVAKHHRDLVIRRWKVIAAFVVMTFLFSAGLAIVQNSADDASSAAKSAQVSATKATAAAAAVNQARIAQRRRFVAFDAHLCDRVNKINATIVDTLERTLKGLPANTYFKEHPSEKARQIREIQRSIREFGHDTCVVPPG